MTRLVSLIVPRAASVATIALMAGGCAAERPSGPVVANIDDAIEAVEEFYEGPQHYFEVSADLDRVIVVVAVDGATAAERSLFADGVLGAPVPLGAASGATFTADAVDFEVDRIFEQLRNELDDPTITDFAIQGGPQGGVVYDATIVGAGGGLLLVLLDPAGRILATRVS